MTLNLVYLILKAFSSFQHNDKKGLCNERRQDVLLYLIWSYTPVVSRKLHTGLLF